MRRLFSSTYCTERSRPIWSRRSFLCLYPMTDVRAITPNCSGLRRPSCEIVSSVRPSARYSLLGSPVRFSNGSTASMIFWGLGGVTPPKAAMTQNTRPPKGRQTHPRTQRSSSALTLLEPSHPRDSRGRDAYRLTNFRRSRLDPRHVLRCLLLRQR